MLRNMPANSAQEFYDPHRFDAWFRRFNTKKARGVAALDAAPEYRSSNVAHEQMTHAFSMTLILKPDPTCLTMRSCRN